MFYETLYHILHQLSGAREGFMGDQGLSHPKQVYWKIMIKKAYQYKQLFNLCSKCSNHLYSVLNVIHFDLYILGSSPSLAKKIKNKEENIALELTLNTPENIEKCICSEKEYNWLWHCYLGLHSNIKFLPNLLSRHTQNQNKITTQKLH